ncbi:MAG TPA: pitrilysin family protein, partial [Candidatus Nanoarchaeia archaeon]|nr:pitrilysin family protein [Candidatus Nanoarchaeia archaeon]
NGGTYYDFTYYYGTVPSENLVAILQGLAYLMFEPIFDPKAMDLEREVVVQEINRTEDLPERILDDVFQETLFKVHPYHQRVLGPMENILNSPQDIVKRYYHDFYVPNNMVLVVVGDVDKTEVLKKAGEIYGKYPSRFLPEVNKSSEPERSAAEKRVLIKDVEQTYWMTGFRGPASSDPDYYVLEVIKGALSNGLSSRLNQHIKEEKKLVNSIGVSFDNRKEASVFAITASFKPEKEQEVEAAIADEFQQLKEQPVSSAELAKVKRLLRKNHIFGLETSESQADNLGYSMIVSDLSLVNNYLEKISAVSSEDIQRVARKYFTFPTTVVVRSK